MPSSSPFFGFSFVCYLSPVIVDWVSHIWQQKNKGKWRKSWCCVVRVGGWKSTAFKTNQPNRMKSRESWMIRNMIGWKRLRMMLALKRSTKSFDRFDVWCCFAIKLKQIVPIKCREKWKNSIYSKLWVLNGLPRHYIASVRLHYDFILCTYWLDFRFDEFHFKLELCCTLNLRAMEKLVLDEVFPLLIS